MLPGHHKAGKKEYRNTDTRSSYRQQHTRLLSLEPLYGRPASQLSDTGQSYAANHSL